MKKTMIIFISILCLMITVVFFVFNFFMFPRKYKKEIEECCKEFYLEQSLVYAIIKAESDFDKDAISKAGAMGLMQLLPTTAKWIASEFNDDFFEDDLLDAKTNIKFGCFYLSYLFKKFENQDIVVCAYNAGETIVKSWLDENGNLDENLIDFKETKNYLKKVKAFKKVYSALV